MTELTLTQEQSSCLKDLKGAVRVRDASGRIIGYLHPENESPIVVTQAEIDTIAQRLADDDSHYVGTSELLRGRLDRKEERMSLCTARQH